jgi:pimeloyl-ACP methyl ester carboxylesterase
MKRLAIFMTTAPTFVAASVLAQAPSVVPADSLPKMRYVTVQQDVRLEVLDWGGTGRSLVMLAGLGNTAHVFDELARKLNAKYHVYGITRRGYGKSSTPDFGYEADRLGDDVLAVLDSLKLDKPVLVGHSIAGEELSSIGSRQPERVAGLVYLDAGYSYAFYDPSVGDVNIDLTTLKSSLAAFEKDGPTDALLDQLLHTDLPAFERDLTEEKDGRVNASAVALVPANEPPDLSSFAALHDWLLRSNGMASPIAELRQQNVMNRDGSVGVSARSGASELIDIAINRGMRKYSVVPVPVLALYAIPHDRGLRAPAGPARAKSDAADSSRVARQAQAFARGIPTAHVVFLPHANHYVFLSNESDVTREMDKFIATLPAQR